MIKISKIGMRALLAKAVLFFGLASISLVATAEDDARKRLDAFFTTVLSIQGDFTQQVFSKKGKLIQQSTGDISMVRPGKFRWVYKSPDLQTIVGNGKNIWVYDEDLEQVTIKPMSQALSTAPIALLTQKQKPDRHFKVTKTSNKTNNLDWFTLTPHRKGRDFKFIEVGLGGNNLKQMIMHDQLGQKTILQLNTAFNTSISESVFQFKIPEGVDVIGKAI